MNAAWVINAVGLFATTAGVLLLFLYLCKARLPAAEHSPEAEALYKHHRTVVTAVGLLAVWLVLQDVALILL
jgi:hypothetical protein